MINHMVRSGMALAFLGSLSSPAYAYLDPATGSIILQAIVGAVASWLMYSRIFATRARAFLARLAGKRSVSPDSE